MHLKAEEIFCDMKRTCITVGTDMPSGIYFIHLRMNIRPLEINPSHLGYRIALARLDAPFTSIRLRAIPS